MKIAYRFFFVKSLDKTVASAFLTGNGSFNFVTKDIKKMPRYRKSNQSIRCLT